MTTWKVEKANTPIPDTVEADSRRVHRNGELEFYNTSLPEGPGRLTRDTLVKLYAPGRWLEVTLEGHVCESLPRHIHNGKGEPVYVDAPGYTAPHPSTTEGSGRCQCERVCCEGLDAHIHDGAGHVRWV